MKRLFTISLFLAVLSIGLKAQNKKLDSLVTVSFHGIQLKEALNQISDQYGVLFSYSDSKIPVNNSIKINYNATPLRDVLKAILHENDISYNVIGNQIVLFPFDKSQTIIIRGRVIDNSSGAPIPFANIALSGTQKGTSSNEEGEFQLSLTKLPSELLFSHLSHEKKLIYIYDDSQEIEIDLLPAQTTLQEITISAKRDKRSNYHLVKKAYDLLSKSMSDKKYGKAFYRQKSSRDDEFTEIFEIFYDIRYSSNGIEDWAIQEGRYAFQNEKEYDIFVYNKNFTLLSRLFPIQQPTTDSYIIPINHDVKKLFDLELKDILEHDERMIAIISFAPKPEVGGPIAQGEVFIDMDNYQVLKMNGRITDEELDIIGFNDNKSTWNNYELNFQISFIDDQTGQIQMDYVQIDHQFDYYYKKALIGKINTSSLLTFYEHYSPVKSKRLGGSINFGVSDMEMIDGIGHNSAFWSQNPIVKRTPLEEKLIHDFEQNEAFGVAFMNNEDEVILLPEDQNGNTARNIISRFEAKNSIDYKQCLFVRMDKENYLADENLRFTAYVLDRWSLKPDVFGSVLLVDIYDEDNQSVIKKKFDINEGMAYGEISLSEIRHDGKYQLKAYTNSNREHPFEKQITISYHSIAATGDSSPKFEVINQDLQIDFFPESGTLLNTMSSRLVFKAQSNNGTPIGADWDLVNKQGEVIKKIHSNNLGIGTFDLIPKKDTSFFLKSTSNPDQQWQIPEGNNTGFSMKIYDNHSRSIRAELNIKPAIPQVIYLSSTSGGRVFSFYEKTLQGSTTTVDLPMAHLPGGKNTLIALDKTGRVIGERTFYVKTEELDIQLESAKWTSKKRAQISFMISNQTGAPVLANLSAVCSSSKVSCLNYCDIRNYLNFGNNPDLNEIDLDLENDSIYALINNILIISDAEGKHRNSSINSGRFKVESKSKLVKMEPIEDPAVAEISISSNYTEQRNRSTRKRTIKENRNTDKMYWIPLVRIDEHGRAQIEFNVDSRSKPFYVNIQGVSNLGHIGNHTFEIDPYVIKSKNKSEKTFQNK